MIKDKDHFKRSDNIADQVLQVIKDKTVTDEWYTATIAKIRLDVIDKLRAEVTTGQIRHAIDKLRKRGLITSERRGLQYMDTTCSYKAI